MKEIEQALLILKIALEKNSPGFQAKLLLDTDTFNSMPSRTEISLGRMEKETTELRMIKLKERK